MSESILPPSADTNEFVTYSLSEVADMTRIPLSTVYELVKAGDLHVLTPRGAKRGWRVTRDELRRYIHGGEQE